MNELRLWERIYLDHSLLVRHTDDSTDIPDQKLIEEMSKAAPPTSTYDTRNRHKGFDTNLLNIGGNVLCAIDTKTSGFDYHKHDIYEICVQPLNSLFRPMKGINPFYTRMKLRRPENFVAADVNSTVIADIYDANLNGIDPNRTVDLFEEWVKKFNFTMNMRILPLAFYWPRQYVFLENWLGPINYKGIFSDTYRDIATFSLFANDRCELMRENYPYQPGILAELVRKHKIDWVKEAGCLGVCRVIADVYKAMLTAFYF